MATQSDTSIVIPPSYNVAAGCMVTGTAVTFGFHNFFLGVPLFAIGILLGIQTGRVRFVFDKVFNAS